MRRAAASATGQPPAVALGSTHGGAIEIEGLGKSFDGHAAVRDFSAHVRGGELLVLLGPSGCGKTTVMRSVAGLETPDRGSIAIGGAVVFDAGRGINVPANRRNVGLVFQSYAVWPHMTVLENVAYPLRMRRLKRHEVRRRAEEILSLFDLEGLADRGAGRLSGGQMQRVALARSVAMEPRALLLDEPLSNLDARLRDRLRIELRKIQRQLGITTIFVTHDQSEALALADRIAVMRDGEIVQTDTPAAIYEKPRTRFVASFVGESNLLRVTAYEPQPGRVRLRAEPQLELEAVGDVPAGGVGWACVRPEHVEIVSAETGPNVFAGWVEVALFMGPSVACEVLLDCGTSLRMVTHANVRPRPGERVTVRVAPEKVVLLGE